MTAFSSLDSINLGSDIAESQHKQTALLQGEILVETRSHSAWGGAVTTQMYLPLTRSRVWQQVTDYPRWVKFFPDVTKSQILSRKEQIRLYQAAQKSFFFLTAQVEVYLNVVEVMQQQIQFRLEQGTFTDFAADLKLQDCGAGTLLTYAVQATPNIPIPTVFIQQAMNLELPANMRQMRQVLCAK